MFKLNKLAVITTALISTSAFAGVNNNDMYIGVGVGQSNLKPDYKNGEKGPSDKDLALQVYAGYDLGQNFGIEASYADLGELEVPNTTGAASSLGYDVSSLQGLFYLPSSSDQLSLYAKLGVSYLNVSNPDNIPAEIEHDYDWSVSGALGARWNMSDNWFARAEYNVYNSDIHAAFLQLGFAFGGSEPVVEAPVPTPAPMPEPTPEPVYVSLDDSQNVGAIFDFDSSSINNSSRLDQIATLLADSKGQIVVSAHTDSIGSEAYNQKLSEQRAQSAVDYFVSKGLDSNRFVAQGMGELHPVASNQTKDGRAQNRRLDVEYTIEQQQ